MLTLDQDCEILDRRRRKWRAPVSLKSYPLKRAFKKKKGTKGKKSEPCGT